MSDIARWLDELGLGQYVQSFAENAIDYSLLTDLEDADLEKLGIGPLGHRKRLLTAIAELRNDIAAVAPEPTRSATNGLNSDAERRQLTVMFCDMVGSTALSTRIDPEDYRDVIRAYQDACAGVIARYDGYVARFMGDGVLAYFGWPRAHEDDAARAINAALALVDAIASLAPPKGEDRPIAARIGIATGPVVIGDIIGKGGSQEAAATGETLNLAARLETIAAKNTVVISDETHALASGLFDYETLGPQTLKGIGGTPEVWRVIKERQVESRFAAAHPSTLTPLIGREEELGLLSRRWEQAKGGDGQVVLLSGEPGIGKSRLTQALQDWIGDEAHTRLLLQCSPHHTSSALYPVINQLEIAARFVSGDDATARLGKLEALLSQAGAPTDESVALMAALLSIPADERYPLPEVTPQQKKDRTLATLNNHLADLTTEVPVLFVLEDAHWIDPTTLELMELTIERIRDLPVLIAITYRPEFNAPWIGEDHVTLLALNRLAKKERAQMTAALIGETTLSREALAQIAERSDGIPLFIEELTRSVRESGVSSGATGDQGTAAGVDIPTTLQDALEARFDRSPAVREVAQVGAAIGREFRYELLAHVASLASAELDAALDDLAGSGLIFVRGSPPDASYTFKHALIQDTAYDSMVRSKRQEVHKRVAKNLLRLQPEITETEPETLAHHYTEAGLLEDAVDWWTKAGKAASARSANPEAVALLERGLALIGDLPESQSRDRSELALRTPLFGPLISVKGQWSAELEAAFTRTLAICETVDAPDEMFRALYAKSLSHATRGQHALAYDVAVNLVQHAERISDESARFAGQRMVGVTLLLMGQIVEAQKHFEIVLTGFDRAKHGHAMVAYGQDPALVAEANNAVCEWVLGWPERARFASERSITEALELDHISTIGPVLSWGGLAAQALSRDTKGIRRTCAEFQRLTSQHKMPSWEVMEQVSRAILESSNNPSNKSAAELQAALIHYDTLTSNGMHFPLYWGGFLAENYNRIGEPTKALEAIERAARLAEASGEHWTDTALFLSRGNALAIRDGVDENEEAESWLRRAVEEARSRQAKSFELRSATSLAQFLCDQGRMDEARETLAPVYDWFTEGFDTPDLLDAKALLNELS